MLQALKELFSFFNKKEKFIIGIIFAMMIIGSLLEVVGIGAIPLFLLSIASHEKLMSLPVIGNILQELNITEQKQFLYWGVVALIALFVTKNMFLAWNISFRTTFIYNKVVEIGNTLFFTYLQAPYTYHMSKNSSELQRNVGDVRKVVNTTLLSLLTVSTDFLLLLSITGMLMYINYKVTIVTSLILLLVSITFARVVRKKLNYYGDLQLGFNKNFIQSIREGLGGIKEVLILNREKYFLDKFSYNNEELSNGMKYLFVISSLPRFFIETIVVTSMLLLTAYLALSGHSIDYIVSLLLIFGASAVRLMPAVNSILSGVNNLQFSVPTIHTLYNNLQELNTIVLKKKQQTSEPLHFKTDIFLDHIRYQYENTTKEVLKGISIRIKKGSAVGFVGSSGAGKTTLIDIILGLLQPTGGQVLVDGIDISTRLSAWQMDIGYIPQSIFLADNTIKNNISLGIDSKDIDEEKLNKATHASQLDELVAELPEGLNTMIGEAGVRLSGGQRQRIGIARALYHNPQLLIMDEATSSLDNITEKYVIESIEKLKGERTIIMIAHRLTTVRNCDTIYFMSNGVVIDSGTYSELLQKNEQFRRLALEEELV